MASPPSPPPTHTLLHTLCPHGKDRTTCTGPPSHRLTPLPYPPTIPAPETRTQDVHGKVIGSLPTPTHLTSCPSHSLLYPHPSLLSPFIHYSSIPVSTSTLSHVHRTSAQDAHGGVTPASQHVFTGHRPVQHAHPVTHVHTHLIAHSLTHSCAHSLTHSIAHALTHSIAYSFTYTGCAQGSRTSPCSPATPTHRPCKHTNR